MVGRTSDLIGYATDSIGIIRKEKTSAGKYERSANIKFWFGFEGQLRLRKPFFDNARPLLVELDRTDKVSENRPIRKVNQSPISKLVGNEVDLEPS